MRIKEYLIVQEINMNVLEETVNSFLENGWQPYGGIIVSKEMYPASEYAQAMVKYE